MRYVQEKPEWAKVDQYCPCGAPETHYGMNGDPAIPYGEPGCGVALTLGCERCCRLWALGGRGPGRHPVNGG